MRLPVAFSILACSIVAGVTLPSSVLAQGDDRFVKANQEYAQGQFKDAIGDYEGLARSGEWSASLFYNLGNAYFRDNEFGRAILAYERALALEPNHPETQANLRMARDHARALELQQNWTDRLLRYATVNQYTLGAAIAFWMGIFGMARLILAGRRTGTMVAVSLLSLLLFAFLAFALFALDRGSRGKSLAIITGSEVNARLATADSAATVLALPPGSEIKVLSRRGDWVYAELPNSLRGWIPAKSLEQVRL
jgi:tetratricopeptide (TPR) repeat protein